MSTKALDIARYKLQMRAIISKLKKLESVNSGDNIQSLMSETSALLSSLENAPITNVTSIIDKRRRKRSNEKLRHKLTKHVKSTKKISQNTATTKSLMDEQKTEDSQHKSTEITHPRRISHQQLRSYRDSNRFLSTFELLELLYAARVEHDESARIFSMKFDKLRSIWNLIRHENLPVSATAQSDIDNQWKSVLFGAQEQSYYKHLRNFNVLKTLRQKWDSYITRLPNIGSSIPRGLVVPRENSDPHWTCYRTN